MKLTRIPDKHLPVGWKYDNITADRFGDGLHIYKNLFRGVVIVQMDFSRGSEKISVDTGIDEFADLKNHLLTLDLNEANKMAVSLMEVLV
jgi:hypothetical protein